MEVGTWRRAALVRNPGPHRGGDSPRATPGVRALALASLIAGIFLAGCVPRWSPSTSTDPVRTPVSIQLDFLPNTNHTGVFVALERAWYAEQGLDVTIVPYAEGVNPDVLVAAGAVDYGFSFAEGVTLARAAGQPVVSLAAVIQRNTSAFITLRGSGLDRPAKLEGTRYAGFGLPAEEAVVEAVIKCDGGATGKVRNITTNVLLFQAVLTGQADFAWIFMGWEGIQAQRMGADIHAFSPLDYCIPNFYAPVIVASERTVRDQADVNRRFMAATARGYEFAIAEPREAADVLIRAAPPGSFPDTGLVYESSEWLAPRYKEGQARWGVQSLETWTEFPRFMLRAGLLTDASGATVTRDLDYAAFFTNAFLP